MDSCPTPEKFGAAFESLTTEEKLDELRIKLLEKTDDNSALVKRTIQRCHRAVNDQALDALPLVEDVANNLRLGLVDNKATNFCLYGTYGQCDACFCALPAHDEWDLEWYASTQS